MMDRPTVVPFLGSYKLIEKAVDTLTLPTQHKVLRLESER